MTQAYVYFHPKLFDKPPLLLLWRIWGSTIDSGIITAILYDVTFSFFPIADLQVIENESQ
jgi:hypothetical protein